MADINTFNNSFRQIKPKLQANIGGGLVDYTNALQNYCIIQKAENGSRGLINQQLDADLFFASPSQNWSKRGLAVQADIQITDNAGASYYTEPLFSGKSSRNRTVFVNEVSIEAKSQGREVLDKWVKTKKTYQNTEITAIVYDLLIMAGVAPANISLTATSITPSVYQVHRDRKYYDYIDDLFSGCFQAYGFDKDGIFRNWDMLTTVATAGETAGKPTYGSSVILSYEQSNIASNFIANVVEVKGVEKQYVQSGLIFYNYELTGLAAEPGKFLFVPVDVEGIEPVEIGSLSYNFFTADQGGTINNNQILLTGRFVAVVDGKPTIRLVFYNTSAQTRYLRNLSVSGSYIKVLGPVGYEARDEQDIIDEGEELKITIESEAITSDSDAASMAVKILQGLNNDNQYYSFEALGKPQVQVGSRVNFSARTGSSFTSNYGIVTEVDAEVSASKGYVQKLTVKKLDTSVQYLIVDSPSTLIDQSGVVIAP